MKTNILILAAMLASLNLHAQGTVAWGNTSSTLITSCINGEPPPAGAFKVGLFYHNIAGAPESALSLYGSPVLNNAAGRFFGGTATLLDITPGNFGTFQVRAWAAAFATYADAVFQGGVHGTTRVITLATGGAGDPASPAIVLFGSGANQLQGFQPCPEPSTYALGLLGTGILFALSKHRRRQTKSPASERSSQ